MNASTMFASPQKRELIRQWCGRFRQRIGVPVEDTVVHTSFGSTHALMAGPASAPPLVLLHGALASSAHVLPEAGPLVRTRRVYALDIIGQSAWSEDRRLDVRDSSYGRWLVEAVQALGLNRYDLFGVSWGGFVALSGARVAPERIGKLILLNPAGIVANRSWAAFRDAGWPFLVYRMRPSPSRLERAVGSLFTTLDPDWTAYFGDALLSYRLDMRVPPHFQSDALRHVQCPVLAFGSEYDVSFPGPALLHRIGQLLPQSELELLKGSKHCPPLTDEFRASLAARIDRFLAN